MAHTEDKLPIVTAGLMSRRTVLGIVAIPLVLTACGRRGVGFALDQFQLADARSTEDQAQVLINAFRMQNNRGPLAIDNALALAAANQSTIMLRKQKMKHEFGGATNFNKRLKAAGVKKRIAAENIAVGQYDVNRVMQAWIDSPPHRKNMLLGDITRFGIAMRVGPKGQRWWTLIVAG